MDQISHVLTFTNIDCMVNQNCYGALMKKIIVFTTDGDSREDGNVYYSQYAIVESDTLQFDEPIFQDSDPFATSETQPMEETIDAIRALGYTVELPDWHVVEVSEIE
jgi:hypothetical protein